MRSFNGRKVFSLKTWKSPDSFQFHDALRSSLCSANRHSITVACCQVPVTTLLCLILQKACSFQMMNCLCRCGPLLPSCPLPSCCKSSQDACCQAAGCPVYTTEESDEGFSTERIGDLENSSYKFLFPDFHLTYIRI